MGIEVDESWPTLQDDLWYKVDVDRFEPGPVPRTCDNLPLNPIFCCKLGIDVKDFITNDRQCTNFAFCPALPMGTNQRITLIRGPFDTFGACAGSP